jgi:hypothetical protein
LAIADHRVSPTDVQFWFDVYDRVRPEIEAAREERNQRRSERPPRRRRDRNKPKTAANNKGRFEDDGDDIDNAETANEAADAGDEAVALHEEN